MNRGPDPPEAGAGAKESLHSAVWACAVGSLALHLILATRYGFHRDELYYVAGGLRWDLGYVDHPFLAPWIAGLTHQLFGASLVALRLWPALIGAATVLLVADMTRYLGGGARAQKLSAAAVLLCPFWWFAHTVFQTNAFDQLAWTLGLWVLVRACSAHGPDTRFPSSVWLAFGAAAALGLASKYTVGLLGVGLLAGLAQSRRCEFRNPALWVGGGIALLGLLPSLWWQITHDLPFREFAQTTERWPPWTLVPAVLGLAGLGALPFLVAGSRLLISDRRWRLLAVTVGTVLLLAILLQSKPYYPNPIYPVLFAAGAVALEHSSRTWLPWLLALNLTIAPLLAPVLPPSLYARVPDPLGELAEMVGWPEFTDQVVAAWQTVRDEDPEAVILTANYGEAGALELLSEPGALPPVLCGQNSYWFWSRDLVAERPFDSVLLVGYSTEGLSEIFEEVRVVGSISNPWGIENDEAGEEIVWARGLREWTPDELIERIGHFD